MADTQGTDTPGSMTSTVVDTDTPSETTNPIDNQPASEHDEIMSDLGRVNADAERDEEEDGEEKPEDKPEAKAEEDPNAVPERLMRDDYLRRLNDLNKREQEIAEREKALQDAKPEGGQEDKPADSDDKPDAKADDASKPIESRWGDLKTQLADLWENFDNGADESGTPLPKGYEAPGEKILVGVIDEIVGEVSRLRETVTRYEQAELDRAAIEVGEKAKSVAREVIEAYGLTASEVDVAKEILGHAQNGGAAALAHILGVSLAEVAPTPENLRRIYDIKTNRAGGTKPAAPSSTKKTVPDLHRGGGPRTASEPQSEHDEIMADINAARAAAGR